MTIFSKIVRGEIPCYKIAENEQYFAFLDINPVARGHTLVIPKVEVDYIFDLPVDTLAGLATFAKPIAQAIDAATGCIRTGVIVEGLEVPHAHIHLIPMYSDREGFSLGKSLSLKSDEMNEIAASIRAQLNTSTL